MFKFETKREKKVVLSCIGVMVIAVLTIIALIILLSMSIKDKKALHDENNALVKENNSILYELLENNDNKDNKDNKDNSNDADENTKEADSDDEETSLKDDETTSEEDSSKQEETTSKHEETTKEEETSKEEETTKKPTNIDNNNNTTVSSKLPFGKLSVNSDGILVGENGSEAKLQGISTHGLAWFPDYVNAESVKYCKEQMGANVFRLALYTAEYNGYCEGGDQNALKQLVHDGVKYATDNNMYVIIDWHVLNDNNPNKYKDQAIAFFREMSSKYKDYDNVIYEICNEPCGGTSWSDIKNYALQVIPVIRENDKDAIIIVGTPNWSQDVDIVANDRITGYDNIMYAFHFYASTHRQDMRNKVTTARNLKLPIFVSEFGICEASGNGWIDENEANTWIEFLKNNHISYVMWNWCNKAEASAMINSWNTSTTWWSYDDLSQAGKWLARMYGGAIANGR